MKKNIAILLLVLVTFCSSFLPKYSANASNVDIKEDDVKNICRLNTLKHIIHLTGKGEKITKLWFIKTGDYEAIFEYDAEVQVGVDIQNIEIDNEEKLVKVILTEPKVVYSDIIEETIKESIVYTKKEPHILKSNNKFTGDDKEDMIADAQTELNNFIAEKKPGFDIAEKNAKELIRNYIKVVSKDSYKVIFE